MYHQSSGLTPKVASQPLQAAHPDRCVEDLVATPTAPYVGPQLKASVALPLPCLNAFSPREQEDRIR